MIRSVRTIRGGRGFTLVELLIAITVFAIGLLGLGALFPAVIAKQRMAIDSTMGAGAIEGIVAQLTSGELVPLDALANVDSAAGPVYIASQYTDAKTKRWINNNPASIVADFNDGNVVRNFTVLAGSGSPIDLELPVASRLSPQPFDEAEPRYVWDMLLRRQPVTDRLEVAVFMRRIDIGIQVPKGLSLSHKLTGIVPAGHPGTAQRLPIEVVEAFKNFRPVTGSATGQYSVPIEIKLGMPPTTPGQPRDGSRVQVQNEDKAIERAAARRGQKLLDDKGVVHEVIEVINDRQGDILVVTPPFEFDTSPSVERVVFTPQVPAQVRVFTVGE